MERLRSSRDGISPLTLALTRSRRSGLVRLAMISAMPNTPMASGTKPMPSNRSLMPKVKRVLPVLTSVPTRPSSMPRNTMPNALSTEPRASTMANTSPSSISEK